VKSDDEIKAIGVVGAWTMGNGIAQVFAQAGFEVCLVDTEEPMLGRARETIAGSLAKFVKKGTLSEGDRDAALGRIATATSLDRLSSTDFVVEAIFEDVVAKRTLFTTRHGRDP
jgi:3-hydroxybutyryl-CoA dehydrogenase